MHTIRYCTYGIVYVKGASFMHLSKTDISIIWWQDAIQWKNTSWTIWTYQTAITTCSWLDSSVFYLDENVNLKSAIICTRPSLGLIRKIVLNDHVQLLVVTRYIIYICPGMFKLSPTMVKLGIYHNIDTARFKPASGYCMKYVNRWEMSYKLSVKVLQLASVLIPE